MPSYCNHFKRIQTTLDRKKLRQKGNQRENLGDDGVRGVALSRGESTLVASPFNLSERERASISVPHFRICYM